MTWRLFGDLLIMWGVVILINAPNWWVDWRAERQAERERVVLDEVW